MANQVSDRPAQTVPNPKFMLTECGGQVPQHDRPGAGNSECSDADSNNIGEGQHAEQEGRERGQKEQTPESNARATRETPQTKRICKQSRGGRHLRKRQPEIMEAAAEQEARRKERLRQNRAHKPPMDLTKPRHSAGMRTLEGSAAEVATGPNLALQNL